MMMRGFRMHAKSAPHRHRGAIVVETAIVLVPMTMLLLGIYYFAQAMYEYDSIVKGVRSAARYLATTSDYSASAARNVIVCGSPGVCDADDALGVPKRLSEAAVGDACTGETPCIQVCSPLDATACPGEPHAAVPFGTGGSAGITEFVTVQVVNYGFEVHVPFMPAMNFSFDRIYATMPAVQ